MLSQPLLALLTQEQAFSEFASERAKRLFQNFILNVITIQTIWVEQTKTAVLLMDRPPWGKGGGWPTQNTESHWLTNDTK